MKKMLFTFGGSALLAMTCLAQNGKPITPRDQNNPFDSKRSTITAGVGFSLAGLLIRSVESALADSIPSGRTKTTSIPALTLSYDYTLAKHFSIGVAGSYQSWSIKIDPYYSHGNSYSGGSLSVSRTNLAVRPLFHFGRNPDLDLYCGIRLGYTIWGGKTTSTDPSVKSVDTNLGNNFAPAAIFGIRYFFTPNIGFNSEASIGAPYALAVGVNFKF